MTKKQKKAVNILECKLEVDNLYSYGTIIQEITYAGNVIVIRDVLDQI